MNEAQSKFLKTEFFILSWDAASQHNKILKNPNGKADFKMQIKAFLENELLKDYGERKVTEEEHITNIEKLQAKTKELGNRLNFGTCQKLMNMMCKYYWCAGYIKEPPHLPIDRSNLTKAGIKGKDMVNWTQIEDKNEYKSIIDKIRKKLGSQSLAEWEIVNWKRKSFSREN